MDTRTADSHLSRLAAEQWGAFDFLDAARCGLGADALRARLRAGTIEPLHHGVYRWVAAPRCFEQDLTGAMLFNGPHAVASAGAAARLWQLPGFQNAGVEIAKPRGRSQRKPYGRIHGSLHLPASHVTLAHGIRVTTPARTIFDLAGLVHPKRTERALDAALSRGLCSLAQVDGVFGALARRGRRGTVLMRELLEARTGDYVAPSSELERVGRALISQAGLPEPRFEVDLGDGEEWVGRVDMLFTDAGVIVELDGRRYHAAFSDRQADRQRDNRLMAAGFRVLRYSWWDLTERPAECITEIRGALRRASAA